MNRTLTAAVALAAAFGMAGLAQAQTSSSQTSPMTTSPSAAQPGMSGTQNPATSTAPGATGTYGTSPQANTRQMNTGAQGTATQVSEPASQSQILQAQQQLKSAGLYRGSVDGVMGPETQTALMKFQREQGLPETSQLDQQTADRLNGGGSASPTTQRSGSTQSMTPSGTTGGTSSTTSPTTGGSYNR